MAIRTITDNKRQAYLLFALCVVIMALGSWEIKDHFASKTNAAALPPPSRVAAAQRGASSLGSVSNNSVEPALRIGELARAEQKTFLATGRNIFSVEPVVIEAPIAPARPAPLAEVPPAPEPPKPPAIDVKYLGYTQTLDKTYGAIFTLGDDSLTAKSGQIIFHRYKVGSIQPTSVQVTDLSFNNTQTIYAAEK